MAIFSFHCGAGQAIVERVECVDRMTDPSLKVVG